MWPGFDSDPVPYVCWVCCWFLSLLRGFFSRFSGFPPSSKTPTSTNSNSTRLEEPHENSWDWCGFLSKYCEFILFINYLFINLFIYYIYLFIYLFVCLFVSCFRMIVVIHIRRPITVTDLTKMYRFVIITNQPISSFNTTFKFRAKRKCLSVGMLLIMLWSFAVKLSLKSNYGMAGFHYCDNVTFLRINCPIAIA